MIKLALILIGLYAIIFAGVTLSGLRNDLALGDAVKRAAQWPLLAYILVRHLVSKNT